MTVYDRIFEYIGVYTSVYLTLFALYTIGVLAMRALRRRRPATKSLRDAENALTESRRVRERAAAQLAESRERAERFRELGDRFDHPTQ